MARSFHIFFCVLLLSSCKSEISLVDRMPSAETIVKDRPAGASDAETWTRRITLGGVSKRAIIPPFPAALSFTLDLPANAEIRLSAAMLTERRVPRAHIAFRLDLSADGRTVQIYRKDLRAGDENSWNEVRADLGAWGGKSVKLTLRAEPSWGKRRVPWEDRVGTAWGDPRIEVRPTTARGPHERPSFIVLVVDTLRADYLGAYGFKGEISPNLDRLAAESIVFEDCFSNAPWTKPSVATLLTSLYPAVHGVTRMGTTGWSGDTRPLEVLPQEAETLAEAFREAGYATAAFVANPYLSPRYGFSQGFDVFEHEDETDVLLGAARRWIDATTAAKGTAPFLLYLHVMDVHGPYHAPRRDFDAVLGAIKVHEKNETRKLTEEEYQNIPAYLRDTDWATEDERYRLDSWRAKYGAGVHALDRRVAPFLQYLRTSGILDRAYFVLTSDHGEELMEHGGWNHGDNLYDQQLHVPLLIRKPFAEDAGRRVASLTSLIDLMPTLLTLGGAEVPPEVMGHDLAGLLQGEPIQETDEIFAGAVNENPTMFAVRSRTNKLIWSHDGRYVELYDLVTDPGEHHDSSTPDSAILTRLRRRLSEHLAESAARGPLSTTTLPMQEELRERLRTLGYIH